MSDQEIRPSDEVAAADWIVTRLADRTYRVSMLLPPGFAAYARILHPVVSGTTSGRRLTRWHEIAARAGLGPLNRRVQFASLIARGAVQPAGFTSHGELPREDLASLLGALARHTSTVERCWFCIWDGYGRLNGGVETARAAGPVFTRSPTPPQRPAVRQPGPAPRPDVRGLLGRSYLLYAGPLAAAPTLDLPLNLWWPDDRAWCVATDVDLDSTYLGGSAELVSSLLAHPDLEVLPADLADRITFDADQDS